MLSKKELLESVDEKYRPMIREISIPDFTKCIAQFSGLHISEVSDSAIKEYLQLWAKNKYRFYVLMGNKIRHDTEIKYKEDVKLERINRFNEVAKEFPAYALWLKAFDAQVKNKIDDYKLSYETEDVLRNLFPERKIVGMSITHFFKNYLFASDELVTKIGKIFENQEIEANYTISIDPVDMMLASENPYNWTSCYRLEDGCHGDGTLAAMLDTSSLITYIWNKEGDYSLYGNYIFKNLRYKKMREYISISPSMNAIHFNKIYPGIDYPSDFEQKLRTIVENLVDKDATWASNTSYSRMLFNLSDCDRKYLYGYGEFSENYIYEKKDCEQETWQTYDEEIVCPCGCGQYLLESDNDEVQYYEEEGFTAHTAHYRHYCSYIDEYCEDYECEENCRSCSVWCRNNAVCELDNEHFCEGDTDIAEEEEIFDPYDNNVVHCSPEFCNSCPMYALHHKEVNIDAEYDEKRIAEIENLE